MHKPKIIVWEIPERDMRAPPAHKYREARYSMDDNEWLLRAAAWIETACAPAAASVKSVSGALGATAAPSKSGEFVEVAFDRPLEPLEYLSARVLSYGATHVRLELSGQGAKPSTVIVPGDDEPHAFRTPLYSALGKGYDKVRLVPGIARQFAIQDVRVCRQGDENLLK
jgi:alginate O-acetyltransferase complex protein AlgJ